MASSDSEPRGTERHAPPTERGGIVCDGPNAAGGGSDRELRPRRPATCIRRHGVRAHAFNHGRACDSNDILVNTLGGVIGYVLVRTALTLPAPAAFLRNIALPGSGARGQVAAVAA